MKILRTALLIVFLSNLPAIAQERNNITMRIPKEYIGYMIYETTDGKVVKDPVRYKIKSSYIPADNDESYEYRNYRIEMQRAKSEQVERDKRESEEKKINSAAYYPLYFD